jgi:hypothetical protein
MVWFFVVVVWFKEDLACMQTAENARGFPNLKEDRYTPICTHAHTCTHTLSQTPHKHTSTTNIQKHTHAQEWMETHYLLIHEPTREHIKVRLNQNSISLLDTAYHSPHLRLLVAMHIHACNSGLDRVL